MEFFYHITAIAVTNARYTKPSCLAPCNFSCAGFPWCARAPSGRLDLQLSWSPWPPFTKYQIHLSIQLPDSRTKLPSSLLAVVWAVLVAETMVGLLARKERRPTRELPFVARAIGAVAAPPENEFIVDCKKRLGLARSASRRARGDSRALAKTLGFEFLRSVRADTSPRCTVAALTFLLFNIFI